MDLRGMMIFFFLPYKVIWKVEHNYALAVGVLVHLHSTASEYIKTLTLTSVSELSL